MSDPRDEPLSPTAPFLAPAYASRSSGGRTVEGSVFELSNWRVLANKVAKVNARFSAATTLLSTVTATLWFAWGSFGAGTLPGFLLVVVLISPLIAGSRRRQHLDLAAVLAGQAHATSDAVAPARRAGRAN